MSNLQFEPVQLQVPSDTSLHERDASSGIRVVIIGAGFAGICAAIECDRKGHSVVVLEKVKELKPLGDLISFGSNAARAFHKWGNVFETLEPLTYKSPGIDYFNWEGRFVTRQNWDTEKKWGPGSISGHRGEIHMIVVQYAINRGIDVRFGQDVTEYFETEDEAGVVSNGERIVGDVVLAAEGVKSPGRKAVLGYEDRPKPSGYAVYRAWYPSSLLENNSLTKHLVVNGDTHTGWVRSVLETFVREMPSADTTSWNRLDSTSIFWQHHSRTVPASVGS